MKTFIYWILLFASLHCSAQNATRIGPSLASQLAIPPSDRSADILWNKSAVNLEEDGHWRFSHYISVRINDTAAARDYGRIAMSYNHYYSDLELNFANARSADGVITPVASDATQLRVTGGGQDFYSDSSELVFSLPDILPGTIIEFQYTRTSKELPLASLYSDNINPYWFQRFVGGDGWRVDHVINHEHSLSSPVSTPIHSKYFNNYPRSTEIAEDNGRIRRSWKMNDAKSIRYENWMAPFHKVIPQLSISTQKDWSEIAQWTWGLTEQQLEITDEVTRIAQSFLLPKTASVEEKTKAVYGYMQKNIRYVFAHLGRGGYKPHYADEVVASSYGDCKDQTILAIALLRALGVEAYPAAVETPRSGRHDTELVAMIFDHMISYIPATENSPAIWMDTTTDSALYPGVSNYLQGQTALIINSKQGQLTQVNDGFLPNYADMEMDFSSTEHGDTLVDVNISLSGFYEQNMRNWWIHTNNRESSLQLLLTNLFSAASNDKVVTSASNAQDLETPFSLSAKFTFPKDQSANEATTYAASFSQMFNLFGGFKNLQTPSSRTHRFVDHYDHYLNQRVNIQVPEDRLVAVLQSSGSKINPHFGLQQDSTDMGNHYYLQFSLSMPAKDLSTEDYQSYFEDLEKLTQLDAWVIRLLKKEQEGTAAPDTKLNLNETDLALLNIRKLIDAGDFETALQSAHNTVNSHRTNGEAWYLLAMAQGLNTLLDESSASFEKAAKLGYLP